MSMGHNRVPSVNERLTGVEHCVSAPDRRLPSNPAHPVLCSLRCWCHIKQQHGRSCYIPNIMQQLIAELQALSEP
jgi:hypothetical protein